MKDLKTGKLLHQCHSDHPLYPFHSNSTHASTPYALSPVHASPSLWHARLGHRSIQALRHLQSSSNLSLNKSPTPDFYCTSCLVSKAIAQPFDLSCNSCFNILDLVHSDVWTSPVPSFTGYKYYVVFVHDLSKFTWFYPMHNKHEVFACFQSFKSHVENLFSTTIKVFRSDNGGEFSSKQFLIFLNSAGIFHQLSCPHTPQ